MDAGVGDANRVQAEALKNEQARALQQYANGLESAARLSAIQLQTAIYTGLGPGDVNQVVRGARNAVIAIERSDSQALRQIGDRMQALADAPTIGSSHDNVHVDGAGTVVIRAEHGESGTVTARWKDSTAVRVDYHVDTNGDVKWAASASGPNLPADANKQVPSTGEQLQVNVQQAGTAREVTRETESRTSTKDRGMSLHEVGASSSSQLSAKDVAEAREELQAHVKGNVTFTPETVQAQVVRQQEATKEEMSRQTRTVSFRVETQNNGTPFHIERPDKRRY
jgi:hypothetical protein